MPGKMAEAIVRNFCKAWEARELKDVLAAMSEDIVYQNVPAPSLIGVKAVEDFIAPLIRNTVAIEFRIDALAVTESGGRVLTERLDRLHFPSGVLDIPVMGIFGIEGGKITEWRDYADFASIGEASARLGISLAAGAG